MTDLPAELFEDPILHALRTRQRHLAISAGDAAVRYAGDVSPFGAVVTPTVAALRELCSLMKIGESLWVTAERLPVVDGLEQKASGQTVQMVLPTDVKVPEPNGAPTVALDPTDDAAEMVALTEVAFPGYFRIRTPVMGRYYGIRDEAGRLIAMSGERFKLRREADGAEYSEISGVCTHPAHRGRGYAESLIVRVAADHRREDTISFLHVSANNQKAIDLYERIGLRKVRSIRLNKLVRTA